jgi:hypothetical protein
MIVLGITGIMDHFVIDTLEYASSSYPDIYFDGTYIYPATFMFFGFVISILPLVILIAIKAESVVVLAVSLVTLAILFIQLLFTVVFGKFDAEDILNESKMTFRAMFGGGQDKLEAINDLQQEVS